MNQITFQQLKQMFQYAVQNISDQSDYINNLNFFPVPDGDTGLNLKITLTRSWDQVMQASINNIGELVTKFAREVLMHAQGNSGVIMSRIIRGLSNPFRESDQTISLSEWFQAFEQCYQLAYTSVSQPTEGTMLTVVRYIQESLNNQKAEIHSIERLFQIVDQSAAQAVIDSPKLLPVLQENQTVDSGAFALFQFFRGFLKALELPIPDYDLFVNLKSNESKPELTKKQTKFRVWDNFGYCCEFVLDLKAKAAPNQPKKLTYNRNKIEKHLLKSGADSIVIVQEDNLLKVHVHLIQPYILLQLGQQYGEFIKIKIDSMTEQYHKHIDSLIAKVEDQHFIPENNSEIYCYLPTTELKKFVTSRFGLKHFWNLEVDGRPTYKDLVEAIYETKARKVYGLITDTLQKRSFLYAEKFINKKQELKLFHVKSLTGMLYILSHYQPTIKNWWNNRKLELLSAKINNIYLTQQKQLYHLYDNKKFISSHQELNLALEQLFTYFVTKNRRYILESDLVIVTNQALVKDQIVKWFKKTKWSNHNEAFVFFVPSDKKFIQLGIIKCLKKSI